MLELGQLFVDGKETTKTLKLLQLLFSAQDESLLIIMCIACLYFRYSF